jgi:hypothetical protein
MNKSANKHITVSDIYLHHPDKTYDINSSTVPKPYFPASEISDNPNALTYQQFRQIADCYLKHTVDHIKTGRSFEIPAKLGTLQLRKYKKKKSPIDFKSTKEVYGEVNETLPAGEKKLIRFKNRHTNRRIPVIKWYRKHRKFAFQWHWRIRLSKYAWKQISKELRSNAAAINRLNEL